MNISLPDIQFILLSAAVEWMDMLPPHRNGWDSGRAEIPGEWNYPAGIARFCRGSIFSFYSIRQTLKERYYDALRVLYVVEADRRWHVTFLNTQDATQSLTFQIPPNAVSSIDGYESRSLYFLEQNCFFLRGSVEELVNFGYQYTLST